jgi:hypothetical protein
MSSSKRSGKYFYKLTIVAACIKADTGVGIFSFWWQNLPLPLPLPLPLLLRMF